MQRTKLTTVRFPGYCSRCKKRIEAGERAYWTPGKGLTHPQCPTSDPVPLNTPKETPKANEMAFDYSELRTAFRDVISNGRGSYDRVYPGSKNHTALDYLVNDWWFGNRNVGITTGEMLGFLENGYRVQGMAEIESLIPAKPRRKLKLAEEGDEMLIDLVWSGDDKPFQTWEKRQSNPGLQVEIHMTFNARISTEVINAYQRWICQALQTFDENHVDMSVSIVCTTETDGKVYKTLTRVRNAGEAIDFSSWSPMFSPGGFRHLGIMATGMHVSRAGGTVSLGHGKPMAYGKWSVDYDDERNLMVIGNEDSNNPFPEFDMTEKLRALLAKLAG